MQLEIGKCYFVRTDTDHWVGRLVEIDGPYTVTLAGAAWIANSGRLHEFIRDGRADNMEVEPVGDIMVHWRALLPWPHELFKDAI